VTLASAAMGAALLYILTQRAAFSALIAGGKLVEVLVFILLGGVIYAVAAIVFGAIRLSDLKAMLKRR
jgi:putative peptidoglycan lipid II flippase